MKVYVCHEANKEIVEALNVLMPQLSSSAKHITIDKLQEIINHDACDLLLLEVDKEIVGCTMLIIFPLPSGKRAWIEDVIVDADHRGCGWGEVLVKEAIKLAKENDAVSVDLTSRPSRVAANKLYQKIGFQSRHTNIYRYKL